MSRATSSTRSVMMTRSLCPRRSWACCASCTLMALSFPTLKLRGKDHSNCTPWAQRSVAPQLSPLAIQLLDFLYGEWGVTKYLKLGLVLLLAAGVGVTLYAKADMFSLLTEYLNGKTATTTPTFLSQ